VLISDVVNVSFSSCGLRLTLEDDGVVFIDKIEGQD
jgi:hypothetical protein